MVDFAHSSLLSFACSCACTFVCSFRRVAYWQDDIYVERAFSEDTSRMLGADGRSASLWVTNEIQHSGLRDEPRVFERLLAMAKGELAIPS